MGSLTMKGGACLSTMVVRSLVPGGLAEAREKRIGGVKRVRTVRFMPPPVRGVMVIVSAGMERAVER